MEPLTRSSRKHGGLYVTVLQFGEDGLFGLDYNPQAAPTFDTTFATLAQAKGEADRRLQQAGHVCGVGCSDWADSN
jgi:hypothetical protein